MYDQCEDNPYCLLPEGHDQYCEPILSEEDDDTLLFLTDY